jgi:hypothetical protein
MTETVRERPKVEVKSISVEAKPRTDMGVGMVEVTVTRSDRKHGSSIVLTSPRNFAFRKEAKR